MMKFALNKHWGGFKLSEEFCYMFPEFRPYSDIDRTDPRLIKYIEYSGGHMGDVVVVELEGEPTDYRIMDYDGVETLLYVVDGKIHTA